jgi:hypothetical protein
MNRPDPKLVQKSPAIFKCPACPATFSIASYGGTSEEKLAQIDEAYTKHFNDVHRHEDASQAAVRIVREATKD